MKLKAGLKSKHLYFKNPLVMPPMATAKADEKGRINEEILAYYEEKTKDKILSAVIVEHCYVNSQGKASKGQCSIADDSVVEGMKKLAQIIHNNDALAIVQISHAGSCGKCEITGETTVAPSAILNPMGRSKDMPKALSLEEIEAVKEDFIAAAKRVKAAGFDGVEIHSAHGFLLNQFLSPLTNKRDDQYGGSILNRIRIHLEIIAGIKAVLGDDFPIFIRLGAGDFIPGGLTVEDAQIAAKELVKAGIEVMDISGGLCFYPIEDKRPGFFDIIAKPIYDVIDIPLILTGGICTGDDVVNILNSDVCDLVGVGRALLKNKNWLVEEIKPLL